MIQFAVAITVNKVSLLKAKLFKISFEWQKAKNI